MSLVIVGSKNPVKIQCAQQAFDKVFPNQKMECTGLSTESGVSDQPMTEKETAEGAKNRAENARKLRPDADFWVGIEGGLMSTETGMEALACMHILHKNQVGKSRTATFQLPPAIVELIHQGIELGVADDMVFKRSNSKQKNGAVGILTHDLIDRVSYYEPAIILALIPFRNSELFT